MDSLERHADWDAALLMDRFVWVSREGWIDLATNHPVTVVDTTESKVPTAAWLARGATLVEHWHSHMVPLLDYGRVSSSRRVEVYPRVDPRPRASPPWWIWQATAAFFHSRGLSSGSLDDSRSVRTPAHPSLLPDQSTGLPLDDEASGRVEREAVRALAGRRRVPVHARAIGIRLATPSPLEGIAAVLDEAGDVATFIWIDAEPRSGLSTFLAIVAREARTRGVVPVCPSSLTRPGVMSHLSGRRVVLLLDAHRRGEGPEPAGALATLIRHDVTVSSVIGAAPTVRPAARVALGPIAASALVERVHLFPSVPASRLAGLVRRSEGLPGRLVDAWLEGERTDEIPLGSGSDAISPDLHAATWARSRRESASHVAERPPAGRSSRAVAIARPASTGVPPLRPALDWAWRALRAARVTEARVAFTRIVEGASEEGSGVGVKEGSGVGLYSVRLPTPLTPTPRTVSRIGEPVSWEALWGLGLCALDAARLDESERWLRATHGALDASASRAEGDERRVTLALARCLFWQGRLGEASRLIDWRAARDSHDWEWHRLRARVDGRSGRLGDALSRLARAIGTCNTETRGLAALHGDYAKLLLDAGDRLGASAHFREALRAARRLREPSRWLRLRLIALQAMGRARERPPRGYVQRMAARLLGRNVPPLIRLRAARALESLGWRRTREVDAFVERWGEGALWPLSSGETAMVSDLQAVLEICRDTDEPLPALERVCHCVRDRLHAASVAIHGAPAERGRLALAGSSRLATSPLAQRVLDSGVAARPAPAEAGVEAGAPVTYAGQTIGAVVCRWTVERAIDAKEAETLLITAATALAPHLQGVLDRERRRADATDDTLGLLGASAGVVALRERIRRVALVPFHVLIEGESGSGKEVVARALHGAGPRRHRRFCALNCAALTDDLIESELFGHARGAFTGAVGERPGLFEDADGGTLFLDEVGELSPRAQAKLLRVIQEGEVRRVGENLARRVDPRLIAATNRHLHDEVASGRFRADLLYRLDVVRIVVPPLRERPEDVVLLARTFWTDAVARLGSHATLHPDTLAALARYHWPGNVRELQNVVLALAVNAPARGTVPASRLPCAMAAQAHAEIALTLDAARRSFEERFVRSALARAGNRPGRAARELGLTRQGLRKLLVRLRIEPLSGAAVAVASGPPSSARASARLERPR